MTTIRFRDTISIGPLFDTQGRKYLLSDQPATEARVDEIRRLNSRGPVSELDRALLVNNYIYAYDLAVQFVQSLEENNNVRMHIQGAQLWHYGEQVLNAPIRGNFLSSKSAKTRKTEDLPENIRITCTRYDNSDIRKAMQCQEITIQTDQLGDIPGPAVIIIDRSFSTFPSNPQAMNYPSLDAGGLFARFDRFLELKKDATIQQLPVH